MAKNIKWRKLEDDLSNWLLTFRSEKIEFRNPYQAMPGLSGSSFRSDGLLTDGKILIAIEIEASQMHPDTNVGKYWFLHERHPYEKIILFHIYTPYFDSYGWRKKLGEFYIKKMKKEIPIDYIQLDFRDAEDYDKTLRSIKNKIKKKIMEEFDSGN